MRLAVEKFPKIVEAASCRFAMWLEIPRRFPSPSISCRSCFAQPIATGKRQRSQTPMRQDAASTI
jgi:hypothetical protein